mmetsp:Transcript_6299/g.13951  ORF Transcript_6299/g.13951 Transcript_6299/m.13951 type:complete len:258 (+) Transcript_6299:59-832(+)
MSGLVMLSDLRGVTVRNTFLELEEDSEDDFPEWGRTVSGKRFARQASEPAKLMSRQDSAQTTAASVVTTEASGDQSRSESSPDDMTDPDDDSSQDEDRSAMLGKGEVVHCPGVPQLSANWQQNPAANEQMVGIPNSWNSGISPIWHSLPAQRAPGGPEQSVPCFCPKCGAGAELDHRFCPYCCFNFQSMPSLPMPTMPSTLTPTRPPQRGPASASAAGMADKSDLLGSLSHFRYMDACATDIEKAHRLLKGLKGRVA